MECQQYTYIIAGDCYVADNDTITLTEGVTVYFDDDYSSDPVDYPEIEVMGTIICKGDSTDLVTFTNYSGTNRGEFKGIRLNGNESATYEGVLEADFTVFEYGGYGVIDSAGLITVDSGAELDLENCLIRFSDSDGVIVKGQNSSTSLIESSVDSCDGNGVGFFEDADADNYGELFISLCEFIDNGANGVIIPASVPLVPPSIIEKSLFYAHRRNGIAAPGHFIGGWRLHTVIRNNYFGRNAYNGLLTSTTNSGDLTIHNNFFYNNGNRPNEVENNIGNCGIHIQDIGFIHPDTELDFEIDIKFNLFFLSKFVGLKIRGWDYGDEWPNNVDVQLNVFHDNYYTGESNIGV